MVSPVNSELAKFYIELSYLHKKAFIEDNFDDFLDKRVNEFGVYRKLGTEATGEVIFEEGWNNYSKWNYYILQ